jgi:hypothetical protein
MVAEAVTFFTGSVAKFEQRGNRSDRRCRCPVEQFMAATGVVPSAGPTGMSAPTDTAQTVKPAPLKHTSGGLRHGL